MGLLWDALPMAAYASEQIKRLGKTIEARRLALDQTQTQFANAGGLSLRTVARIERAEVTGISVSTFSGLDRAAGWTAGSARRKLEDDIEPTFQETTEDDAAVIAEATLLWMSWKDHGDLGFRRAHADLATRVDVDTLEKITEKFRHLTTE